MSYVNQNILNIQGENPKDTTRPVSKNIDMYRLNVYIY